MSELKVGAMFAGYGGLELGLAQVLDVETTWVAEFDAAPSRILAHRYPDAPNLGDVTKVDWSAVEPVDIITGGSPCQDLSHAGKRAGMKAGTRSGLWASMCDAIDIIRPRLVLWENVRGALSAEADSAVEPCPICVGDPPGVTLRALGRVLGDLAELGYDAAWCGLRAADVGAPHGRFRVFVLAWPAADAEHDGRHGAALRRGAGASEGVRRLCEPQGSPPVPTWGSREWRDLSLLRTPTAQLAVNGGSQHPDKRKAGGHGPTLADEVEHLLPTPAVNDMGRAYTPETWDAWTERMKAAHGNGNGLGKSLEIEAQRLLPTPRATDGTNGGPNQRGSSGDLMLPSAVQAFVDDDRCPDCGCPVDLHDADGFCGGRCGGNDFDCYGRLGIGGGWVHADAGARLLPTPTSTDHKASGATYEATDTHHTGTTLTDATVRQADRWGQYAPAIARWEALTRPAPAPTEPTGKNGAHRLSPRFVEWMQGLPDGWVTDVPGITRNDMLKALGNGVVPQQAAGAIRHLLSIREAHATRAVA